MDPLVSICCVTYNHEKYISDAIESFLMQKLSFPFEIIIYDDASTDNTPNIIRRYEKKYSQIIKPIYQIENQYSKGKKPLSDFIIPLVKGKYIAICEGDDYWIDIEKLKKQVNFLENNKEYVICFHAVKIVDTSGRFIGQYKGFFGKGSKEVGIKDVVNGGVMHASSKFVRSDFYKKIRPEWINNALNQDYATSLYAAAEGRVFYIDEVMSAYRIGVENSVMTNFRNNYSKENDINYNLNRIETLNMADKFYNYKYYDEIKKVNLLSQITILLLKNDYSNSARNKYIEFIKERGYLGFIKLFLLKKCPSIAAVLVRLKRTFIKIKTKV